MFLRQYCKRLITSINLLFKVFIQTTSHVSMINCLLVKRRTSCHSPSISLTAYFIANLQLSIQSYFPQDLDRLALNVQVKIKLCQILDTEIGERLETCPEYIVERAIQSLFCWWADNLLVLSSNFKSKIEIIYNFFYGKHVQRMVGSCQTVVAVNVFLRTNELDNI